MIGYLFLFTTGTYFGVKVGFKYKERYYKEFQIKKPSENKNIKEIVYELNEYAYSKNISEVDKSKLLWSLNHRIERELREQYDLYFYKMNRNI